MYSLIIVDYKSLQKTIEYVRLCLEGLGKKGASHVVIVQNGLQEDENVLLENAFGKFQEYTSVATQKTVHRYANESQEILYCNSGENLGYARGNNLGALLAQECWNDSYYIFSNNDLVFNKPLDLDVVERIFCERNSVGAVGPRVVSPNGQQQSPRRWLSSFSRLILTYWIGAFGSVLGRDRQMQITKKLCSDVIENGNSGECAWISGCFMFLRADSFHKAGMFDKHTFLYAEEMILSKRLASVGSSVYFCNELEVVHFHAETTKNHISTINAMEIDFEANCYFYEKYACTSKWMITFARMSFALYKALYRLKKGV